MTKLTRNAKNNQVSQVDHVDRLKKVDQVTKLTKLLRLKTMQIRLVIFHCIGLASHFPLRKVGEEKSDAAVVVFSKSSGVTDWKRHRRS